MGKKDKMTWDAARRIQSSVDRKGGDKEFKSRAMKAASRNEKYY